MNLRDIIAHYDINGHEKDGGTDKDTFHSYVEVYEDLLSPLIMQTAVVAEIGIQYGGSMLLWQDYLPRARFIYLDNKDAIHDKIRQHLDTNRAYLIFEDAYTKETAAKVKKLAPNGINFIIDDGPHSLESQCAFIHLYAPLLADGGVAIIEDVQAFEWFDTLKLCVPNNCSYEIVDRRAIKGRYDDLMFIVKRKADD